MFQTELRYQIFTLKLDGQTRRMYITRIGSLHDTTASDLNFEKVFVNENQNSHHPMVLIHHCQLHLSHEHYKMVAPFLSNLHMSRSSIYLQSSIYLRR